MNKASYIKRFKYFGLLIVFMTIFINQTYAADRYLVATGNWNSTSVWASSPTGGTGASVPGTGDVAFIQRGFTV